MPPPLRPDEDVNGLVSTVVVTVAAVLDEVAVVERVLRSSGGGPSKVSSVGFPHPPAVGAEQQAQRFVALTKTTSDVARKGCEFGTA